MHSEYFNAACSICACVGREPEPDAPFSPFVLLDVVVPRFAITGDFEPPHPAARSGTQAREPMSNNERTREPNIAINRTTRF
jgi:hypothetical protein